METLQPKLRFPEFDANYKTVSLKEITTKIGDGLHSTPKYDENGSYFFINGNNLVNGVVKIFENTKKVDEIEFEKNKKPLTDKTILLSINGTIGSIANYNNERVILGKSACYINVNNVNNKNYVYFILQSDKVVNHFNSELTGTTIKNLSLGTINKLNIQIPELLEQTKIANFLSVVDTKINQLTQKKNLLEQYKKGVMQKIFNQEIRFKDDNGNDFADWEEKCLGEIGDFQTSSVDKLYNENEKEVYLVNYMNVYRHETINTSSLKNLSIVTAKEAQIVTNSLRKGDILFTPSSETPDDIGHSVVIFEDLENTLYSYHLLRFRPKIEIDILYSHYFCNDSIVLKQLSKYATGSTRFTISVGNFSKIEIKLPPLKEQTKIANFLSAIDENINQVSKQLENTTHYKKGLLQQMFV